MLGGPVAMACRVFQCVAHGQWVGRCRTSRRELDAIRAGTLMILVCRLALVMFAATAAARAMLNAITAQETQAAFAAYFALGRWASGPSLSSAMVCSTIAWSRWRWSASRMLRVPLVMNPWWR